MLYSLKSLCKYFDQSRSMETWPNPENDSEKFYFDYYQKLPNIIELFMDKEELYRNIIDPLNSSQFLWISGIVKKRKVGIRQSPKRKIFGIFNESFSIYSALKSFCYMKSSHGIPRHTLHSILKFFSCAKQEVHDKHRLVEDLAFYLSNSSKASFKENAIIPNDFFKKELFPYPTHLILYDFILYPEVPTCLSLEIFINLHVLNPSLEHIHFPIHHDGLDFIQSEEFKNVISNQFEKKKKRKIEEEEKELLEKKKRKIGKETPSLIISECKSHTEDPFYIKPENRLIDYLFKYLEEMSFSKTSVNPKSKGENYRGNYNNSSDYGNYSDYDWKDSNVPIQYEKKRKCFYSSVELFPIWSSELKSQETTKVSLESMSRQGSNKYLHRMKKQDEELGPFIGTKQIFLETIILNPCTRIVI